VTVCPALKYGRQHLDREHPMTTTKFQLTNLSTGKATEFDAIKGTLGPDVLNIASINKDHGIWTFDPGFMATASTESRITYIDGDQGVLTCC
jgi:citrate synthase